MSEKLVKIMYERATKSSNPERYVEVVKMLYDLQGMTDEEFIKDMGW